MNIIITFALQTNTYIRTKSTWIDYRTGELLVRTPVLGYHVLSNVGRKIFVKGKTMHSRKKLKRGKAS